MLFSLSIRNKRNFVRFQFVIDATLRRVRQVRCAGEFIYRSARHE